MSCMICGHQWCWTCGMSKANKFHKAASIFCELIAVINFNEKIKLPWLFKIFFELLFLLLFPAVLLFFGIILVFYMTYETIRNCFGRSRGFLSCCRKRHHISTGKCQCMRNFLRFILILILSITLFILYVVLAVLAYAIFVAPLWIVLLIILAKKTWTWLPECRTIRYRELETAHRAPEAIVVPNY